MSITIKEGPILLPGLQRGTGGGDGERKDGGEELEDGGEARLRQFPLRPPPRGLRLRRHRRRGTLQAGTVLFKPIYICIKS